MIISQSTVLMLALALQLSLFALGWKLVGSKLGLAPTTASDWAMFCLSCAGSMLLFVDDVHVWLGPAAVVMRNALLVLSFMLLHRGMLRFLRQEVNPTALWGMFAAYLLVSTPLGAADDMARWRTVLISAVLAWYLLRAGGELIRTGAKEFGRPVVGIVSFPILAFGLVMVARMVLVLVRPDTGAVSVMRASSFNTTMLLGMLAVLPTTQFMLGFLVLIRLVRKLQHLSHHDGLTGLYNRRAFDERLRQELASSRRTGLPLGLLMVDIDHFKLINDRHGHAGGDQALQRVAERLSMSARANDVVARLGGEEFGVMLPATDAAGIRQAAERLRRAVCEQPLAVGATRLAVSVSVGASMRLSEQDDEESLLRRADQGLYRAKSEGRNRVVFDTLEQVGNPPASAAAGSPSDTASHQRG